MRRRSPSRPAPPATTVARSIRSGRLTVVPPWYRRKGFDVVRARTALDVPATADKSERSTRVEGVLLER